MEVKRKLSMYSLSPKKILYLYLHDFSLQTVKYLSPEVKFFTIFKFWLTTFKFLLICRSSFLRSLARFKVSDSNFLKGRLYNNKMLKEHYSMKVRNKIFQNIRPELVYSTKG